MMSRAVARSGRGAVAPDLGRCGGSVWYHSNLRFDDLRGLLREPGFVERVRGSHHAFRKGGVEERINLQRDDGHAKPYQVRQVRRVILKYALKVNE